MGNILSDILARPEKATAQIGFRASDSMKAEFEEICVANKLVPSDVSRRLHEKFIADYRASRLTKRGGRR